MSEQEKNTETENLKPAELILYLKTQQFAKDVLKIEQEPKHNVKKLVTPSPRQKK